jgi:flagellar biosynthetic protein FliR
MTSLALFNVDRFLVFTLVLTRISGLVMASPVMGAKEAPMTIRALISLALAVLIMPSQWSVALPYPGGVLVYVLIIAAELVIGLVLGMGITILISGIQLAGDMVSRVGGLALADVFDPSSSTNVPLFSQLLSLVSTAIFMLIGGHRIMMTGLLDTFRTIPPGGCITAFLGPDGATPDILRSIVDLFTLLAAQSFQVGIRAAAPLVAAVLLATLVLGLVSRTLPQLNVMVVGFGLNAMLTFAVFSFALGAVVLVFQDQIAPTLQTLFQALKIPLHSS